MPNIRVLTPPPKPTETLMRFGKPLMARQDLVVGGYDEASDTFPVSFGTGELVLRYDWYEDKYYWERLIISTETLRLKRWLKNGAPFFMDHRSREVQATVGRMPAESIKIENGELVARVRPSQDERHAGIIANMKAGILRETSLGYVVWEWRVLKGQGEYGLDIWEAVDLEPTEGSLVGIGADANAGVRSDGLVLDPSIFQRTAAEQESSADNKSNNRRNDTMTPEEEARIKAENERQAAANAAAEKVAKERAEQEHQAVLAEGAKLENARQDEIRSAARDLNLPETDTKVAEFLRDTAKTPDEARREFIRMHADADRKAHGDTHTGIQMGADGSDKRFAAMSTGLAVRAGGRAQLDDAARPFANYSFADFAREICELTGINCRNMSPIDRIQAAMQSHSRSMSTSDFALLLQDASMKNFMAGYSVEALNFEGISVVRPNIPNFKTVHELKLSGAKAAAKVTPEGAEIEYTTLSDGDETWNLVNLTNGLAITRKTLVNDDMNALGDVQSRLGASFKSAMLDLFWAMFTDGRNLSDSLPLFRSTVNYTASSGGKPGKEQIAKGRKMLRLIKDLDGKTPMQQVPNKIIGPAALETEIEDLFAAFNATTAAGTMPRVISSMEAIIESRLDTADPDAWYLQDTRKDPAFVHGYLQGQMMPTIQATDNMEIQGVKILASHDFGCGIRSFRSIYKNAGK